MWLRKSYISELKNEHYWSRKKTAITDTLLSVSNNIVKIREKVQNRSVFIPFDTKYISAHSERKFGYDIHDNDDTRIFNSTCRRAISF